MKISRLLKFDFAFYRGSLMTKVEKKRKMKERKMKEDLKLANQVFRKVLKEHDLKNAGRL